MTREQLQALMFDCLEHDCSPQQLQQLEQALNAFPDLKAEWLALQQDAALPALSEAFPLHAAPEENIREIRAALGTDFTAVVISWFPKYMAAAAAMMVVLAGAWLLSPQTFDFDEDHITDWIYQQDERQLFHQEQLLVSEFPFYFNQSDND
ncbi:MAG: hypothetical protein LAT75_07690 [Candidatus Cyclonatronum sp.]|uniref:hypothetical protein n=1 Tax=Cyclonatronum sp. TaxID=3024185 RepID=UPI0025C50E15|nr:hypothetical protein [Cyclonatronum sp.]MCC5934039.1 hypothetical protein [Balneolales bacterium]MCH8486733.1 hypothetical protein [Cyclonatronum sp.]